MGAANATQSLRRLMRHIVTRAEKRPAVEVDYSAEVNLSPGV